MGNALPPHIYDTKLTADRKLQIGDSENELFQQNRLPAAPTLTTDERLLLGTVAI